MDQEGDITRREELEDLVRMEIADILASAKEAGFSLSETLDALAGAIETSKAALAADQSNEPTSASQ